MQNPVDPISTSLSDIHHCLRQAAESVLSALSGCKILRELSKLETETDNKVSMKELAQSFENLAHGETSNVSSTKVPLNNDIQSLL